MPKSTSLESQNRGDMSTERRKSNMTTIDAKMKVTDAWRTAIIKEQEKNNILTIDESGMLGS